MKKALSLLLIATLLLSGCTALAPAPTAAPMTSAPTEAPTPTPTPTPTPAPTPTPSPAEAPTTAPAGTLGVDKNGDTVTITIPASLLAGSDLDKTIADAKAEGVTNVVKNPDGSLTYTMTKAVYEKMMADMKAAIVKSIDDLMKQGTYKSIKDIAYNDNFTDFTLTVDEKAFNGGMDGFVVLGLYIAAALYEVFDGNTDMKVTFHLVDAKTKKEFKTIHYPEDMKAGA